MKHTTDGNKDVNQAATLLGKRSWEARVKRYGMKKLKQKLSAAGKAAKRSGRPRLPDDQSADIECCITRQRRSNCQLCTLLDGHQSFACLKVFRQLSVVLCRSAFDISMGFTR